MDDTTQTTRPSWLLPTPERREEVRAGGPLRSFILRLMRGESLSRAEASSLLTEPREVHFQVAAGPRVLRKTSQPTSQLFRNVIPNERAKRSLPASQPPE